MKNTLLITLLAICLNSLAGESQGFLASYKIGNVIRTSYLGMDTEAEDPTDIQYGLDKFSAEQVIVLEDCKKKATDYIAIVSTSKKNISVPSSIPGVDTFVSVTSITGVTCEYAPNYILYWKMLFCNDDGANIDLCL